MSGLSLERINDFVDEANEESSPDDRTLPNTDDQNMNQHFTNPVGGEQLLKELQGSVPARIKAKKTGH